jgi:peptidoglycan L-alanyl-D-glutamate endopeptidase CwlK
MAPLTSANRDVSLLHPLMRAKAASVLQDCIAEGLPIRLFEGWRSPVRQRYLYEQGRTRPGNIITYARGWESYHQYGLASDFVGFVNGNWTWDLPRASWNTLHDIGRSHGLEPLGFETPHLQIDDLRIGDLMDGEWPEGGDASWFDNLAEAVAGWDGRPAAPPLRSEDDTRPPLVLTGIDWSTTVEVGSGDWHSMYDGKDWRFDGNGVYLRAAPTTPVRTPGAPTTCQTILDLYGRDIHKASVDHGVPPELIVMTIATETAFAKRWNFTGPNTFRWEAHVEVRDVNPHTFGDYSPGPMQALGTTARDVIRRLGLAYPDPFAIVPYYPTEPDPRPAQHPLYAGGPNIDIGTAEIRTRVPRTGLDPILVAAAYNAGGLYRSTQNDWHLRSHGDHLDRAAAWFGDACFIFSSLRP